MCTASSVFSLVTRSKMSGEFARSLGKGGGFVVSEAEQLGNLAPGPVPEGTIRLYSMRYCPFAQRTRLILKAKGINHEIVNINLKNKPEWFFEKNPFGMVPVLETSKGQLIYESPITCEYLDEAYPEKKLYPADPYEKAYQKMLLEYFSKLPPITYKYTLAIRNGEDASAPKSEYQEKLLKLEEVQDECAILLSTKDYTPHFSPVRSYKTYLVEVTCVHHIKKIPQAHLRQMLANRKTKFFGGDSVSMIDYLIWPWFERMEAFQLLECLDHTPGLKCWVDLMKLDPAVQATITDPQIFKGFAEPYYNNNLEACDYGL